MKTFILGLGAHKSGTTWLAQNLMDAGVNFPLRKEARIWNNLKIEDESIAHIDSGLKKLKGKIKKNKRMKKLSQAKKLQKQFEVLLNPQKYFELMSKSADSSPLNCAGDITPIYCDLNIETLKVIKNGLQDYGFNVKVLFSMRDPIERAWSAARMTIGRREAQKRKVFSAEEAYDLLQNSYKSKAYLRRVAYQNTIHNISRVFNEDEYLILFFEEIINKELFYNCKLDEFLGFKVHPSFEKKSNISPSFGPIPEDLKMKLAIEYKTTYEYIRVNYPKSAKIWSKSFKLFNSQ